MLTISKNIMNLQKQRFGILVFTAIGAARIASFLFDVSINYFTWLLLLSGMTASSVAANTLTGYNDRDIYAVMDTTKDRSIP